jgi:hypothetical protein
MTDSQMEILIAARETEAGWVGAFRVVINACDANRDPGMDSIVQCTTPFKTEAEALQHAREHADEYTKLCVFLGVLDPSVMLVDFSTISHN